ncbi:hypothetical protein SAMN04487936_101338 [Halobacillus dabanensis]|uniref:Competence protein ComGE n=1 Tax=Halobacillus dabanensis TaxID=240302 RepID=A0A1I3PHZ0_HALDA|nr:hypothetical protein [Halobacillus dabanensis]SFJ21128.1 hypothetical protein SAMN04487936_101338 [Halobacillus dabanensis]
MVRYTNTSFTFLSDEKGSIFPWVLMVCYLLLLVTFTGVQQLKSQLIQTSTHKSAVVKQHILEQSRNPLEEELVILPELSAQHDFIHSTPNGEGTANCIRESEMNWACDWIITDRFGGIKHTMTFHSLSK